MRVRRGAHDRTSVTVDTALQIRVADSWVRLRKSFVYFPDKVKAEIAESNRMYAMKAWPAALEEQGPSTSQAIVLTAGAEAKQNSLGVTLRAATSGASLSGGLNTGAGRAWAGFEFGATPKVVSVQRLGHPRDQLINVQFAPRRSKGKVVYPAARKITPGVVGRWVKAVVKAFAQGHPNIKTR